MACGDRISMLKAYEDVEFLKTDACRAIRLELEFLRPDLAMFEQQVISTIVVFGSARIPSPELAEKALAEAEKADAVSPHDAAAQNSLKRARAMLSQSHYYTVAREFAAIASREGQEDGPLHFVVITGGGGGIMEAGNRGAADVGAKSIGLNISLPFEQHPNPYITPGLGFEFHYFSIRKMHFLKRAKALCAFPGGFGTMDEVFEALTLVQTKKIPPMPIVLFGREYWDRIIAWQEFVDRGLISPEDLKLFHICETASEGWEHICAFYNGGY